MNKVRWGIISTASIGTEKVIPAIQQSALCDVVAIASRDLERASTAANKLNIPKVYGSYEELLDDSGIDAIYNPLPNHLHVPWSIKAIEAGKHVLCEKPVGLNADDATRLIDAATAAPEIKVMEAFMYRFHPQWQRARELVLSGTVGELRTISTIFSYFNNDPENIRNDAAIGGGGLMDIGCYPISQARFLFDREPSRVFANLGIDPDFQTDREVSAILDFDGPTATFTCSTQMDPFQRTQIMGTEGRIEILIPVNARPDHPETIVVARDGIAREEQLPQCDQYSLQADAFAKSIIDDLPVPTSLNDAISNMRVIDALVKSHHNGSWQAV